MPLKLFCKTTIQICIQTRNLSNKSAIFSKPHRLVYARLYPTLLVMPEGSSVTVRFPEPRKIIKLPLDLETLSESDKKARLEKRKPRKKVVIEEDIEDSFNSNKYLKFIKRKQ